MSSLSTMPSAAGVLPAVPGVVPPNARIRLAPPKKGGARRKPPRLHNPAKPKDSEDPKDFEGSKFEQFPQLPAELRLKIFEMYDTEPRRVDVIFEYDGRKSLHKYAADIPALLHVCSESRFVMLKKYEIAFDHGKALNKCYFNFDLDTLYIPKYSTYTQRYKFVANSTSPDSIKRLQRLAIDERSYADYFDPPRNERINSLIFNFQGLKELMLVTDGHLNCGRCGLDNLGFRPLESGNWSTPEDIIDAVDICQDKATLGRIQGNLPGVDLEVINTWQIPEIKYSMGCRSANSDKLYIYNKLRPAGMAAR